MSLRTTQQIDKLIVGQIFPRDCNNNYIPTGQILLTDATGRANWTTLSSVTGTYTQFTSLSTQKGTILATALDTAIHIEEGAGMNFQIISNSLYVNTTAFTAIDIEGGNSLLSSNSSNNVINSRLKFGGGNYTKIRGDPGTNTIFIDVDLLSTTQGSRAAYTQFIIQNNSSFAQPDLSQSVILDALVSSASLTLIGIDDLQISNANLSPSCNVIFIGLSTITTAKFSTLYTTSFDGLSNLSVSIDVLNRRQINTQGVQCNAFFPVSSQTFLTSTNFGNFITYTFTPIQQEISDFMLTENNNFSTLSSYINIQNGYLNTVSNTGIATSENLIIVSNQIASGGVSFLTFNPISTIAVQTSTLTTQFFSTLSSYIKLSISPFPALPSILSTTLLSTGLLTAFNISTNSISTNYGFFSSISAGSIYGQFIGDGSLLTGIPTTSGMSIVPPILSTTLLSTGLLTASNISTNTISTNYGFFSTISANKVYGQFIGDGSLLTGLTAGLTSLPSNISTNLLSTTLLTAQNANISSISVGQAYISSLRVDVLQIGLSTGYIYMGDVVTTSLSSLLVNTSLLNAQTVSTLVGFFSTISAGKIYGQFVGDGSLLTGLPTTSGMSIVPPILSTTLLSTGLLTASNISTNAISTNYGFFSSLSANTIYGQFIGDGSLLTNIPNNGAVLTVSNSVDTISNNLTTVSNSVDTISNAGVTVNNNLTTVSNSVDTISNRVDFLLNVSNISAFTISTTYGFFSTISANIVYGQFVGDGSQLTNLPSGGGISIVPPILSTTLLSTGLLTASNISTNAISTNYGFFSTISAGSIYGQFIGDGSLLTGLTAGLTSLPSNISTNLLSTTFLTAQSANISSISVGQAYISSLRVDFLQIGLSTGILNMGDVVTTTLSSLIVFTGLLDALGVSTVSLSTNYGFFSTISAGKIYGQFIGDGSLLTNIPNNGAVLTLSNSIDTVSNNLATVSTNLNAVSTQSATNDTNIGIQSNLLSDVSTNVTTISTNVNSISNKVNFLLNVSNISAFTISTTYGFFSTISAGTVNANYFIGDGSQLTNLPSGGGISIVPPILSTTLLSTGLLTASNISTNSISTNYGFFSTISAGSIYGQFIGDGSLLTGLPAGLTSLPSNISTSLLSTNLLTAQNANISSISVGHAYISSLRVDFLQIGLSTGILNMGDVVTTTLSSLIIFTGLLDALEVSTVLLTTNYGFFSTISAGSIYGQFIGDGSLLTNIPNNGAVLTLSNSIDTVSNNLATVSTNLNAVSTQSATNDTNIGIQSNLLSDVSTNVTTISTNLDTISNRVDFLLNVSNISAFIISTTFGFFSTISAGKIYGQFVGDGSQLTNLPSGGGISIVPAILSTTLLSTGLLTASNISTNAISTNYGFFSTISAGSIYGRFIGDGSLLTGLPAGLTSLPSNISTSLLSTTLLTAQNANISSISVGQAYISSLRVDVLQIGLSTGYIYMGDLVTTSLSTLLVNTSLLNAQTVSTSYGFFSTISASIVYSKFVGDGSLITNIPNNGAVLEVSNNLTTVSNRVNFLANVSNISAFTTSTTYGFFSTISSGSIYGKFAGDASLLTSIPNNGAVLTVSNNVTTVSNLLNSVSTNATTISTNVNTVSNTVNYLLTVSNISAFTLSTTYGFFSTISAGTIYGKHIGDASLLTNIPNNGAVLVVSNNVTTVSNLLNSVSTNATTMSTNLNTVSNTVNYLLTVSNISAFTLSTTYGFFSTLSSGSIYGKFIGDASLLTNIPNNGAVLTVSNNVTTVSNLLNSVSTNVNTISNTVNYLLTVSNISAFTLSTTYGFFSTLSSGSIYGKHIGDGSLLTNVPFIVPAVLSTNSLSTGLLTASNISATSISTTYGFFSTISAGTIYAKFVGDGSGLTGIVASGGISIVPPILSTTLLSTGLLTASNISVAIISTNTGSASTFYINKLTTSTVTALLGSFSTLSVSQVYISSLTVDNLIIGNENGYINMGDIIAGSLSTSLVTTSYIVAGNISVATISTNYGFFSTISAGTFYGKFIGDGSQLTNLPGGGGGGISIVPPILSTTLLSTGLLTASNVSTNTQSTNYGFFSTISANKVYGQFFGDGSMLTNLPTSSLSLSSGNISISTITLIDTANNSTGTIYERSSLLYFNTFVVGGAYVWTSQLIVGN